MKNKIFATMGGAIAALCPWMARAETFPTDGNMLENKTYESAATYDNMGVYDGTVTAAAEYADVLYNAAAGTYLPAASEDVAACPAGYYCPGLSNVTYSGTINQGLNACPDGYPMSESGASAKTQCYTACTDVSAFAHATAVAGNNYYGAGVDTCYVTECVSGYHVNGYIEMVETDPLIDVDVTLGSDKSFGYISLDGSDKFQEGVFGLTENGTWASEFDYGTIYGQASCQGESPDALALSYCLSTGISVTGLGSGSGSGSGGADTGYTDEKVRIDLMGYGIDSERADAIADVFAEWKAGTKTEEDFRKACHAFLDAGADANFSTSDSGQYCYCQMTDFKPIDGIKASVTSAPWVFFMDLGSPSYCASDCADNCANFSRTDYAEFRAFWTAMFGMLGTKTVNVCAANEISITWDGADAADVAANNAGTTTYDGDIRTPVKAQSVPGKIFKGWRFNK